MIRYKVIELEFSAPIEKVDPTRQVLETLKGLENLATKLKKTVVVFMDEFQMVLETPKGKAIQGSIRHVAQSAKHVAFLFSGSSRHMLSKVFDDSNLPLYMICEKINVERIESQHYYSYIQDAARIQWKKTLPEILIKRVLELTEDHPFYVNYICTKLWQGNKPPVNEADIDKAWQECLLSEMRRFIVELDKLTLNQRLLLKTIAHTSDLTEPTSSSFLSRIGLSSGTAVPILKALTKKDIIFVDKKGITRVLDPLLKYMLLSSR